MIAKPLRKLSAVALAGLFVLTACGPDTQNEQKLRGFVSASNSVPHTFDYVEAAQDRWFEIKGSIADDLRYRFTLSSPQGPVVDFIIIDDALAVRLLQPAGFAPFRQFLGHPDTADALLSGAWVEDPAGAPPLATPVNTSDAKRPPTDPIQMGSVLFRTVVDEMSQVRAITEFNLDDIAYRPDYDPWRYPLKDDGEVRYDLLRPTLPIREDQIQQGQISIGESQFRKTSVFIKDNRVEQVCEIVDVAGHEEFVKNRENGNKNTFLVSIEKQVLEGRTETPVRQRSVFASFGYPERVDVSMPRSAVRANLSIFMAALREGFKQGLIAPPGPVPARCLRTTAPTDAGGSPSPTPSATPSA